MEERKRIPLTERNLPPGTITKLIQNFTEVVTEKHLFFWELRIKREILQARNMAVNDSLYYKRQQVSE